VTNPELHISEWIQFKQINSAGKALLTCTALTSCSYLGIVPLQTQQHSDAFKDKHTNRDG